MTGKHYPGAPSRTSPDDGGVAQRLLAMQHDPMSSRALAAWQRMAVDAIEDAIDGLTRQLAARSAPRDEGGHHYDVIQARALARRRQAQLQQCRDLAREMVLATVCHLSDRDWDPFAPCIEGRQDDAVAAPADNILGMLLDLKQPARP